MNIEKNNDNLNVKSVNVEKQKVNSSSKSKQFFKTFMEEALISTTLVGVGLLLKRNSCFKLFSRFGKKVDKPFTKAVVESQVKEKMSLTKIVKNSIDGVKKKISTTKSLVEAGLKEEEVEQVNSHSFDRASLGLRIRSMLEGDAKSTAMKADYLAHVLLALTIVGFCIWKNHDNAKTEDVKDIINQEIKEIKKKSDEITLEGKKQLEEENKLLDLIANMRKSLDSLSEEEKLKFSEAFDNVEKDIKNGCNEINSILLNELPKYNMIKLHQIDPHQSAKEFGNHLVGALLGIRVGIMFKRSHMIRSAIHVLSQYGIPSNTIKKIIVGTAFVATTEGYSNLTTQTMKEDDIKNLTDRSLQDINLKLYKSESENKTFGLSAEFLTKIMANMMTNFFSSLGKSNVQELTMEILLSSAAASGLDLVSTPALKKKEAKEVVEESFNLISEELKKNEKIIKAIGENDSSQVELVEKIFEAMSASIKNHQKQKNTVKKINEINRKNEVCIIMQNEEKEKECKKLEKWLVEKNI